MAKIISRNVESNTVIESLPIWRVVILGILLGVSYWFLTLVLSRYIDSIGVSGDIATIIVAAVGIVTMLNLHMTRPLLIAVGTAVSLWGLAKLTNGLNEIEIVFWSALIYGISYTLFYWLNRYKRIVPVLIASIIIVVITRIATTL